MSNTNTALTAATTSATLDLSNYPVILTYPKGYRPRGGGDSEYFSRTVTPRVWRWLKETYGVQPFLMGGRNGDTEMVVFVKNSPNRPTRRHYADGSEIPDIIIKLSA